MGNTGPNILSPFARRNILQPQKALEKGEEKDGARRLPVDVLFFTSGRRDDTLLGSRDTGAEHRRLRLWLGIKQIGIVVYIC